MSPQPVLKHSPDDFLVRENMVVPCTTDATGAKQHYLTLHKCGYTTMEAVRLIAGELGIAGREITYGGLKDEDGITEQLIALPHGTLSETAREFTVTAPDAPSRWLYLRHYGYGSEPLRIGRLEGNGFAIVVRGLDRATAERLAALRKINLFFLNYYDTQRFGVPGGPKRTHLVGAAILAGDWHTALGELAALNAPESTDARRWDGPPRDFFTALDPRTTSFYLAAHASHGWNALLGDLVSRTAGHRTRPLCLDGLDYLYVTSIDAAIDVLAQARELPCTRYTYDRGTPEARQSARPTVVQTTVGFSGHRPDRRLPGGHEVGLNFFLPSGSYATAAVRQLFTPGLLTGTGKGEPQC